jgi:5-methylcytosine-specific restriction endonuclease McrA
LKDPESKKLYDWRWRQESQRFLKRFPFCAHCERPAEVVDHIEPHRQNRRLFWDRSNWQPLCRRCHDIKTAREVAERKTGKPRRDYIVPSREYRPKKRPKDNPRRIII